MFKHIKYTTEDLKNLIIHPQWDCNKYTRGNCIAVAGSIKYPGSAILVSSAAQKLGSGYTKLYTVKQNILSSAVFMPSIPVESFSSFDFELLNSKKPHSFVCGSGFDPNDRSQMRLVSRILNESKWPVVLDGGALSYFSDKYFLDTVKERNKDKVTIITPHKGEANNIYSCYYNCAFKNDLDLSKKLVDFTGCIVVLKGPDTYISSNNVYHIMKSGSPALAKAGSGDVLAGIIGGLICQNKIKDFDACVLATYVHAFAGILAAKDLSDVCVCPEDLIDLLPRVLLSLS